MPEKIVQLNEEVIKGQIKELVRGSVEETLNGLLEAEVRMPAGESGLTARRGARRPAKWCMAAAAVVHTTAMQGCFTP
ncbi:hypothetical protein [Oscillibacter ruminantium]